MEKGAYIIYVPISPVARLALRISVAVRLQPCKPFAASTQQLLTFHKEIQRISKRDTRLEMFLDGRVIIKWCVVKRQAVRIFCRQVNICCGTQAGDRHGHL